MKEKLDMLEKQSKPDCELNNECAEDWQKSYTNVYKNYEKQRIQIIQDEYLAKIIQNEEFLNELKQNKDFMQTLDSGLVIKSYKKIFKKFKLYIVTHYNCRLWFTFKNEQYELFPRVF